MAPARIAGTAMTMRIPTPAEYAQDGRLVLISILNLRHWLSPFSPPGRDAADVPGVGRGASRKEVSALVDLCDQVVQDRTTRPPPFAPRPEGAHFTA